MRNVAYNIDGDLLTIKVDLSKELGRSKSGKTMIVASTGGNVDIGHSGIKLGLNMYKK